MAKKEKTGPDSEPVKSANKDVGSQREVNRNTEIPKNPARDNEQNADAVRTIENTPGT